MGKPPRRLPRGPRGEAALVAVGEAEAEAEAECLAGVADALEGRTIACVEWEATTWVEKLIDSIRTWWAWVGSGVAWRAWEVGDAATGIGREGSELPMAGMWLEWTAGRRFSLAAAVGVTIAGAAGAVGAGVDCAARTLCEYEEAWTDSAICIAAMAAGTGFPKPSSSSSTLEDPTGIKGKLPKASLPPGLGLEGAAVAPMARSARDRYEACMMSF